MALVLQAESGELSRYLPEAFECPSELEGFAAIRGENVECEHASSPTRTVTHQVPLPLEAAIRSKLGGERINAPGIESACGRRTDRCAEPADRSGTREISICRGSSDSALVRCKGNEPVCD